MVASLIKHPVDVFKWYWLGSTALTHRSVEQGDVVFKRKYPYHYIKIFLFAGVNRFLSVVRLRISSSSSLSFGVSKIFGISKN